MKNVLPGDLDQGMAKHPLTYEIFEQFEILGELKTFNHHFWLKLANYSRCERLFIRFLYIFDSCEWTGQLELAFVNENVINSGDKFMDSHSLLTQTSWSSVSTVILQCVLVSTFICTIVSLCILSSIVNTGLTICNQLDCHYSCILNCHMLKMICHHIWSYLLVRRFLESMTSVVSFFVYWCASLDMSIDSSHCVIFTSFTSSDSLDYISMISWLTPSHKVSRVAFRSRSSISANYCSTEFASTWTRISNFPFSVGKMVIISVLNVDWKWLRHNKSGNNHFICDWSLLTIVYKYQQKYLMI
jgi:hypothetical protein